MDASPTAEQEIKHAAEVLAESKEHTDVATEEAEKEGEDDGLNADSATVTSEVADAAPNILNEVESAAKQLIMALNGLQKVTPELAYIKSLSKTVAENTPQPQEGMPGNNSRRFQARPPSLLQRLNQQSAPQRYRLQSRGRTRR